MGYAPVFFPGTADPGGATVLTIGPAEVREGIDFPLQFVATSRVEGTIVDVDGRPVTTAILNLLAKRTIPLLSPIGGNTSRTDNSGKFSFAGVLPGDYTLVARAQTGPPAPPSRAGGAPMRPLLWAQQDLSVSGSDVTGLGVAPAARSQRLGPRRVRGHDRAAAGSHANPRVARSRAERRHVGARR